MYTYSVWCNNIHVQLLCTRIVTPNNYIYLENSPEKIHADWLKIMFLWLGKKEPAQPVDVMKARAKRIYILTIKVNNLFSFFLSRCFLKEIETTFSTLPSSYTNAHESLGELEKVVKTLACGPCSHTISRSPKLPLVLI